MPRHPEAALEAVAPGAQARGVGQAAAVVGDGQLELLAERLHPHDRPRRFGVAADVREGLLGHPIDGALELLVEPAAAVGARIRLRMGESREVDLGRDVEAVDRLCPPRERLQGRRQTEVVERRRPAAR